MAVHLADGENQVARLTGDRRTGRTSPAPYYKPGWKTDARIAAVVVLTRERTLMVRSVNFPREPPRTVGPVLQTILVKLRDALVRRRAHLQD